MAQRIQITYAVHPDGYVISRVDSDLAWPILQYDQMTPENGFAITYELEKIPVFQAAGDEWRSLRWTKKIPVEVKNVHRQFWGLKPLEVAA